jgi:hypothetical protein
MKREYWYVLLGVIVLAAAVWVVVWGLGPQTKSPPGVMSPAPSPPGGSAAPPEPGPPAGTLGAPPPGGSSTTRETRPGLPAGTAGSR